MASRSIIARVRRRVRARLAVGHRAERAAERYLRRRGLKLVARNYQRRTGEIDRIMLDGQTLVIVEVRHRGGGSWQSGLSSVDQGKQQRLVRTTELFRRDHPQHRHRPLRFDVVSTVKGNYRITCNWIRDAF